MKQNFKISQFFILGLLGIFCLAACSGTSKTEQEQARIQAERSAEQIYSEAMQATKDGEFTKARNLFDEVERQHPYSDLATKAQLQSAEISYKALRYDEAIVALERFIDLHPSNPQTPYAAHLRALCFYEQISDITRDQGMTKKAMEAFEAVIQNYPTSEYARDAQLKIDLTRDHLAGKEMDIGRYYLKKKQINAAINRFQTVVDDYQTTSHVPEALHRLVESYMTLGLKDEALKIAAVLGTNYPGSKWYRDSFALLEPSQRSQLRDNRSWINRTVSTILKPE